MRSERTSSFVDPHAFLNNRVVVRVLLVLTVLNPLVFIWQGGDLTDTGFHALRAQNFFADVHTEMIPADAVLSYFIGGLWWQVFPGLGLFGFHLLGAIVTIIGTLVPFFALKELREHPVISLVALLAAQAFSIRTNLSFGYDLISMFFQYMAVVFMYRGMAHRKASFLFMAGGLITAAALARIPSILALGLIVLPLVWKDEMKPSHTNDGNAMKTSALVVAFRRMALILIGSASAFLLAAAIGQATGTLHVYLDGVADLFTSSQQGGSHNKGALFTRYFDDAVLTVEWLGLALLWMVVAWFAFDHRVPRWAGLVFIGMTSVVLFIWLADSDALGYRHPLKYLVLAIYGPWSVLLVTGALKTSSALRTMAVAGLILIFTGFLGSNTGLLKTKHAMLFLIPICTVSVWYGATNGLGDNLRKWKRIALLMAGLVFMSSFVARFGFVYHASQGFLDRLSFTHAYETPLMFGIHSSKERVAFVDEIVPSIVETDPERELFVYGRAPALYFLTERKPFIKEVWLGGNKYSADMIKNSLDDRIAEGATLPLLVITDRSTLGADGKEMISDFLTKHDYTRAFERSDSSAFPWEIWTPARSFQHHSPM
ncbi:MAG: hypothetical protein IPH63_04955 [Flavobacteriales bacterium]|nr:hypothetical protein [Flavobacteriales bacterium]